jgi:hypothetical protein
MTCKDEVVAIIEPPQEIEVVIEKVEIIKLDDVELLKIYQQGKEDYKNGKTNTR